MIHSLTRNRSQRTQLTEFYRTSNLGVYNRSRTQVEAFSLESVKTAKERQQFLLHLTEFLDRNYLGRIHRLRIELDFDRAIVSSVYVELVHRDEIVERLLEIAPLAVTSATRHFPLN